MAVCCLYVLDCLLSFLESMIEYINMYALAVVAIYGEKFMIAASQAWQLMMSRGFDAVVNDSLVNGVCNMAILLSGLVTGVSAALLAGFAFHATWQTWAGVGFLVGAVLMLLVTEVAESCVITLFICLASDPAALATSKPREYHMLMEPLAANYPGRFTSPHHGDSIV